MTQEVAELLKKVMALPADAREELASSLLDSLGKASDDWAENGWIGTHRKEALTGLGKMGRIGYMEASFHNTWQLARKTQSELVRAAESATIHAFGWPIGVVLHTEGGRPKPMSDSIVVDIAGIDSSYDHWALRADGEFYLLGSLFEDERTQNAMWFDTRIMRVTETFLFCYRLYKALGVPEEGRVRIRIGHGGLRGRVLSSAKPAIWGWNRTSQEENVHWEATVQLAALRTELRETVKAALSPLFILFDFFQPPDEQVYSQVDQFLSTVSHQQKPFEL